MKNILLIFLLLLPWSRGVANPVAKVGIYVKNLNVNLNETSFRASFYWWMKFKKLGNSELDEQMQKIEFINGITGANFDYRVTESVRIGDSVYVNGYCNGTFNFNADFHRFPFDTQYLPIIIESTNLTADSVTLQADQSAYTSRDWMRHTIGIDTSLTVSGFNITSTKFIASNNAYRTNFGDTRFKKRLAYSRVGYVITIKREPASFLMKMVVPNLFLLLISYLVFFVPAKALEVAVGMTVTSLLASIALQLTFQAGLPDVGYLTSADKIFYLFYFLITSALVQTVTTYNLEKKGKTVAAYRLEQFGRYLYPLGLFFGFTLILVL